MRPDEEGPRRAPVDRSRFDRPSRPDIPAGVDAEAPEPAEQDWDALEGAPIAPDGVPEDAEGHPDAGRDEELPEEDDDNPDQESDQALPDDEEERAIRRDMGGLGTRYEPE
ncbi:MAG: hypothetical protein ACTHNH_23945 [Mesorhizobium sp.]